MRNLIYIGACCSLALAACGIYRDPGDAYSYDTPVAAGQELEPIGGNRFTFSDGQDIVGQVQLVRAHYEDTFVDFARAYGLGFDDLVATNPDVDPWLPGEGTLIVLPTQYVLPLAPRRGIVLNLAAKRLFYYPPVADGEPRVVETFPIGIGRAGWATPTGATTIVSMARDPVWFVPQSVRDEHRAAGDPLPRRVPPGPDNPLGRYALGLGFPGYLIHGTNKPAGVGMRVSHGCIRLYPEDIEHIFGQVGIGTPVRIVNQPYLFGWRDSNLYLEAHAPLDEDNRQWLDQLLAMAQSSRGISGGTAPVIDAAQLNRIAGDRLGYPVPVGSDGSGPAARDVRLVTNILARDDASTPAGSAEPEGDIAVN